MIEQASSQSYIENADRRPNAHISTNIEPLESYH